MTKKRLADTYDLDALDDVLKTVEKYRSANKPKARTDNPLRIARYNAWTQVKVHVGNIREALEKELS